MKEYKFRRFEPYWIINRRTIEAYREGEFVLKRKCRLWKLIYTWLNVQLFFFRQLYFKKCNNKKEMSYGHFLGMKGYCLRCKKSIKQIKMERLLGLKKLRLFT